MGAMAPQITSVSIVYSFVCSSAGQRKHQNSASLAFVRGIHRWPVNSPHKGPVTRKMFPLDDVIVTDAKVSSKTSNKFRRSIASIFDYVEIAFAAFKHTDSDLRQRITSFSFLTAGTMRRQFPWLRGTTWHKNGIARIAVLASNTI